MNNPLLEKAKYYLNESNRLSEELNSQVEYSAVLEAVLEELVGTEDFLAIMEVYSNPGSIEYRKGGLLRSNKPGTNNIANVTKRVGQLGKILSNRQLKPKPAVDNADIPLKGTKGNDGARSVDLTTRGDVHDQIDRDEQAVIDAANAFANHGGHVTPSGSLMPSASNDNSSYVPMSKAKEYGFPVHIDPKGPSLKTAMMIGQENTKRLERKGVQTQAALDQPTLAFGSPGMTKGELAKKQNAKKASTERMDAGRKAAKEAGMINMPEHSNLVQTIMKFLVK